MTHRVTLTRAAGETAVVDIPEDETVLDGAETAGVSLPFGCRTGACGTCTGQLVSGTVEHRRRPVALKDRHRATGYVLTCLAEPREDCRLRVGPDVVRELVSNPFE